MHFINPDIEDGEYAASAMSLDQGVALEAGPSQPIYDTQVDPNYMNTKESKPVMQYEFLHSSDEGQLRLPEIEGLDDTLLIKHGEHTNYLDT